MKKLSAALLMIFVVANLSQSYAQGNRKPASGSQRTPEQRGEDMGRRNYQNSQASRDAGNLKRTESAPTYLKTDGASSKQLREQAKDPDHK